MRRKGATTEKLEMAYQCDWRQQGGVCTRPARDERDMRTVSRFGIHYRLCPAHHPLYVDCSNLDKNMMPETWPEGNCPVTKINKLLTRLHRENGAANSKYEVRNGADRFETRGRET